VNAENWLIPTGINRAKLGHVDTKEMKDRKGAKGGRGGERWREGAKGSQRDAECKHSIIRTD
jgi:hypothetical protein